MDTERKTCKHCGFFEGHEVHCPIQQEINNKANARQVGGTHYKVGGEEHWDRVNRLGLDYLQGQITKYVERWKLKNGVQDLEKARHFLDKYIELAKLSVVIKSSEEPPPPLVNPSGYVGWTYEGGTKDWDLYRCVACREAFNVKPGEPPPNHDCGAEASPSYVDQG